MSSPAASNGPSSSCKEATSPWRRSARAPASRTRACSPSTSIGSSASRRGGSGRPQESDKKPQLPPRIRLASRLQFPTSRMNRRGRADGEDRWSGPTLVHRRRTAIGAKCPQPGKCSMFQKRRSPRRRDLLPSLNPLEELALLNGAPVHPMHHLRVLCQVADAKHHEVHLSQGNGPPITILYNVLSNGYHFTNADGPTPGVIATATPGLLKSTARPTSRSMPRQAERRECPGRERERPRVVRNRAPLAGPRADRCPDRTEVVTRRGPPASP